MQSNRGLVLAAGLVLALLALAAATSAVILHGIAPSSADCGTTFVATVFGIGLRCRRQRGPLARRHLDPRRPLRRREPDAPPGNYTLNLMNGGVGPCVVYQRPDAFTVTVPPPGGASFTARPPSGPAPLTVTFAVAPFASLSTPPATSARGFGDGEASREASPVHVYTAAGRYTVTLVVSDAGGRAIGKGAGAVWVAPGTPGDERAFFLADTAPPGADVYTDDSEGTRVLAGNTAWGPVNITVHLAATPLERMVANLSGYSDAVHEIAEYPAPGETVRVHRALGPAAPPGPRVPGGTWRLVPFLDRDDADVPAVVRPVRSSPSRPTARSRAPQAATTPGASGRRPARRSHSAGSP